MGLFDFLYSTSVCFTELLICFHPSSTICNTNHLVWLFYIIYNHCTLWTNIASGSNSNALNLSLTEHFLKKCSSKIMPGQHLIRQCYSRIKSSNIDILP